MQNKGLALLSYEISVGMFRSIVLFCASENEWQTLSTISRRIHSSLVLSGANAGIVQFKLRQLPRFYTPMNEKIYFTSSFNQWKPNDKQLEFDRATNSLIVDFKNTTSVEFKITRGSWTTTETWADGTARANRKLILVMSVKMQWTSLGAFQWDWFNFLR